MGIWCISIRSCLKNPPLKIKVQKNINSKCIWTPRSKKNTRRTNRKIRGILFNQSNTHIQTAETTLQSDKTRT